MSKYICPYQEEDSSKYIDFCLIVSAIIMFMIAFTIILILFAIHQPVGYIVMFSIVFGSACILVMVIINIDHSKMYLEENDTGLFGAPQRPFKCIHAVVVYFVIVSFIFLFYCVYVGIDYIYLTSITSNITTDIIVIKGFGYGSFILLILIMCLFMSCRWCTNVGRFKQINDDFYETKSLLSYSESSVTASAPPQRSYSAPVQSNVFN